MLGAAIVASSLGLALYELPNRLGLMIAALAGVAAGHWLEQRSAKNRITELSEIQ
jgi:proteasome assembly chaperone (PAC2) family protein